MGRFFFRFVTIHAFDGQTERRTDRILIARPRLHSMQRGKNVGYSDVNKVPSPCKALDSDHKVKD